MTRFTHLAREIAGIHAALLLTATLLFGGYVFVRNMVQMIAP